MFVFFFLVFESLHFSSPPFFPLDFPIWSGQREVGLPEEYSVGAMRAHGSSSRATLGTKGDTETSVYDGWIGGLK